MNLATTKRSTGRAGEESALFWFRKHGWQMWKTPPAVKVCGVTKKPGVFQAVFTEGGMADFLGWRWDKDCAVFCACEVKEATPSEGDSVGHSRLSEEQRAFMSELLEGMAFVGILWRCGTFEVFPFNGDRGSYKKGEGIR